MKAKNLIIGGIVIGGIWYFSKANQLKKTYQVEFSSLKFNTSATKAKAYLQLVFDLALGIVNPTAFAGELKALNLKVYFNEKYVGTITRSEPIKLQPNLTTVIPFQIGLNTLSLFQTITDAIYVLAKGSPMTIKIIGTALTDMGSIDINVTKQAL